MFGPNGLRHFHTKLIAVSLSLLSAAVIFDFFGLLTGGSAFGVAAYWMAAVGLTGTIVAAMFGWLEWTLIPSRSHSKGMAFAHALLNTLVVILYGGSLLSRSADPSRPQIMVIIFSMMAGVAALVGGWVGGEMIDAEIDIQVDTPIALDLAVSDDRTATGLY